MVVIARDLAFIYGDEAMKGRGVLSSMQNCG